MTLLTAMPDTSLIQNDILQLVVKSVADDDAVDLLKHTVYGTNGLRYAHTGQGQKVVQLHNPFFFHLYVDGKLQGLYCLDHRITEGEAGMDAFYGRYLTVAEPYQRKGYGQLLKTEAVKYITAIWPKPFVFYSYIESKNTRSMMLSRQLDFISVTTLKTLVFRRLYPSIDARFCQLSSLDSMLPLLQEYYKHHSLTVFTKVFDKENYYVLKTGDTILVGVHANPVTWQFAHMPGVMGWIMMNVLPQLPVLNRLFKPTYSFLALEGLYMTPGNEHLLPVLIESVLAQFKLNTALLLANSNDPLLEAMQTDKGWLSGYQQDVLTHVLVKPVNLTEEQFRKIQQSPVYVSSFDFT